MYHYTYIHPAAAPSSKPLERHDSCSPPRLHTHLDGGSSTAIPTSEDVTLEIRQQPKEALLTTDGKEKSRKPVDPPPIIQLTIKSDVDPAQHYLQSPYLFMCCSLYTEEQKPHDDAGGKSLAGSLVSSLHRLKDINNCDGGFFVFGDISVKIQGVHRLQFSLFDYRKETNEVVFIRSIMSEPFKVLLPKDFRGMDESTYLSRAFSDQGVRLRLRKEPRAMMGGGNKRNYTAYAMGGPPHDTSFPPQYGHPPESVFSSIAHSDATYGTTAHIQTSQPPTTQHPSTAISPFTTHIPSSQASTSQHPSTVISPFTTHVQSSQPPTNHHTSTAINPFSYADHDHPDIESPVKRARTGSGPEDQENSRGLLFADRPSVAHHFSPPYPQTSYSVRPAVSLTPTMAQPVAFGHQQQTLRQPHPSTLNNNYPYYGHIGTWCVKDFPPNPNHGRTDSCCPIPL